METVKAVQLFEALASEPRLEIYRLLVRHAPGGLVVGEIANNFTIPSTTLSFHLKAIHHSGLITMEKEGRYLRYRADTSLMIELVKYLTAECCSCRSPKNAP